MVVSWWIVFVCAVYINNNLHPRSDEFCVWSGKITKGNCHDHLSPLRWENVHLPFSIFRFMIGIQLAFV